MMHFNPTPFAFYTDLALQNHRLSYAAQRIRPLIGYTNSFLPFQIISLEKATQIQQVYLCNIVDRQLSYDINFTSVVNVGGSIVDMGEYSIIVFYSGVIFANNFKLPESPVYMVVETDKETFYSELFLPKNSLDATTTVAITYWDKNDFLFQNNPGGILYSTPFEGYRNILYLDVELAKPEYLIDEVVDERDGFKFFEKQLTKKTYKFSFLAPEYLCDAISLIPLHDYIRILHDGKVYPVYDCLFTPEWLEDGFYAKVEAEFTTNAIFKKLNAAGGYSVGDDTPYDELNKHGLIKYDPETEVTEYILAEEGVILVDNDKKTAFKTIL